MQKKLSPYDAARCRRCTGRTYAAATAGVRAVVDRLLELAEGALMAERLDEAIRSIETARDIDAAHPRLSFMDMQIARERDRIKLSQARDTGLRVRTLVAQAGDRMQDGNLISPNGASARDALLEARRLDPTDPTVAQGIRGLNTHLVETARKLVTAGKTEDAHVLLNAARQLGSAGTALASVERMLAENTQRMATGNSQRRADESAKSVAPVAPAPIEAAARHTATISNTPTPLVTQTADSTAVAVVDVSSKESTVTARTVVSAPVNGASSDLIQAATVPRTCEVAAIYPKQARMDMTEGWVDIDFTISPEGVPTALNVRNARPRRVFDRAAMESLQQWRFVPIMRNGTLVAQRATLRVRFALQ